MKKISTLLSFFALILGFMNVNAQTPPASIKVGEVELLDNPVYFNGGTVVETNYFFESAALPKIEALPAEGQTLLITQPADANKGVGQVIVCDDKGSLLPNSTFTIRFIRKYDKSKVIGSCDIVYELKGEDLTYTFTFNDPQTTLEQVVEPFPSGAVLKDVSNFKDAQETPVAIDAATIAKTTFFDGGKAYVKVTETGVVYTLNFSILENTNTAPTAFNLTLKDGTPLYVTPDKFSTTDGGEHYLYDDVIDRQIKRIDVTPADVTQSIVFLYQSYDSVAVMVQAENGDSAIYSFVYGKALESKLEVTVSVEDTKISGTRVANFDPSNRVVDMVVKDNVSDFPIAQYDVASAKEKKQTVFVSSRPDKNQSVIYVKAENGDTISYVINYITGDKRYSVNLENITVAGNDFIFDKDKNEFTVDKRGKIEYVKESQFSNVTVLDSDTGAVIIVTAENGDHKEYYIHYKSGATTPEVNKVYYDGTELTGDPMLYTYPGLDALKLFSADITGDRYFVLQQGSELPTNDVIIRAFSGETFADNTIEIVADRPKSSNADLDSLFYYDGTDWVDVSDKLGDATIEIPLENYKSHIPPMSVVADRYAKVTITYAKASTEHSTIEVVAEDDTSKSYDITYTIKNPKSNDANLTAIYKTAGDITEAIPSEDLDKYPITIEYDPAAIPEISWVRSDKNAMVSVDDYDIQGVNITIDAEDGTNNGYYLTFNTVSPSDKKNVLQKLSVNGYEYNKDNSLLTNPASASLTLSGHEKNISSDLNIVATRNYEMQPIMITNYRGYQNYKKTGEYLTSIVDLGNGGDKNSQKYLIPISSGTTSTIEDLGDESTDVNIFIDGYKSGSNELDNTKLDDNLDHSSEKLDVVEDKIFYVPYDFAGRWPIIEVQTRATGQQVSITNSIELGHCIYTVKVYSRELVNEHFGNPPSHSKVYYFSFIPKGTDQSAILKDVKINGISLIGTADENGKIFDQTKNETYKFVVDADSVPLVTFTKDANGQRVITTMTQPDPLNPWKYNVHFKVIPADLDNDKINEFDIEMYQYKCNDGKFESLGELKASTFDPDIADYTGTPEIKDAVAWPKLTFERSTPYDAVTQVLTSATADFTVDCEGSKFEYNVAYNSDNTALGAILVNGEEQDLSGFDSDNKLEVKAATDATIEIRVAEEGQKLDIRKVEGKDEYVVTVTAQNEETKEYTLVFTKELSDNVKLSDLSIEYGFEGDAVFDAEEHSYGAYAHNHKVTPTQPQWRAPIIGDMYAEHAVGQTVDFKYTRNTDDEGNLQFDHDQTFTVTAENGTEGEPYVISVKKSLSEYLYLDSIAINGVNIPYFKPDIFDYTSDPINYPAICVVSTPTINWSTRDAYQTVECEGNGTEYGIDWPNKCIRIKVTAGFDGTDNSVTYILPITYPDSRLNDKLANLWINDEDLKDIKEKNIKVEGKEPDLKNPQLIQPVLQDSGQIAVVIIDKENHTATVNVTTPNGEVTTTAGVYTFVADDDAKAVAAVIDGTALMFDNDKFTYTDLDEALSTNPSILVLPKNRWQTVSDVTLDEKEFVFTVTAADGKNEQPYRLSFNTSALDPDVTATFEIDEKTVEFTDYYYEMKDCNLKSVLDMRAVLNNEYQSLEWQKVKDEDDEIFAQMSATVTARNGATQQYFVTFYKNSDADLSDIKLKVGTEEISLNDKPEEYVSTPAEFSKSVTNYEISFDAHKQISELPDAVFVLSNDNCQTLTTTVVSDNVDTILNIATVTAQNGVTKNDTVTFVRRLCDIATLETIKIKVDGTWYDLSDAGSTLFNSNYDPTNKSYVIEFNDFITLPTKDDIDWVLSCLDKDSHGDNHETAFVTLEDPSFENLKTIYIIHVTSQSGKTEDYTIVFNNHTDEVKTLDMIFVQPKDDECYDGSDIPLTSEHQFYDVPTPFSQTNYGPYIVNMHKDCTEEECVSAHWPEITFEESGLAKASLTRGEEEWSEDYTYKKQINTIDVEPIKHALNPEDYPIEHYIIELRDPVCTANGLLEIKLKRPNAENPVLLSKNDSYYYKADKPFTSVKVNAHETEDVYNITMPEGWLADSLPLITYDSLCRREKITAKWERKDADGAEYVIEVSAQNGGKMTYRLIFTYNKSTNTDLCNIYVDGVALEDFKVDTRSYNVDLDPCTEFPTIVKGDLTECDNLYAKVSDAVVATTEDGRTRTYTLTVTPQDETVIPVDYKVTYTKTPTDETYQQLAAIRINGRLFESGDEGVDYFTDKTKTTAYFTPSNYGTYTLYLLENVTDFPQVVGYDKENNPINATKTEITEYECEYSVQAPSDCDGKDGKIYTIVVYKYQKILSKETTTTETKLYIYGMDYDELPTEGVVTNPVVFSTSYADAHNAVFGKEYIYKKFFDGSNYNFDYPSEEVAQPESNVHLSALAAGATQSISSDKQLPSRKYSIQVVAEDPNIKQNFDINITMQPNTVSTLDEISVGTEVVAAPSQTIEREIEPHDAWPSVSSKPSVGVADPIEYRVITSVEPIQTSKKLTYTFKVMSQYNAIFNTGETTDYSVIITRKDCEVNDIKQLTFNSTTNVEFNSENKATVSYDLNLACNEVIGNMKSSLLALFGTPIFDCDHPKVADGYPIISEITGAGNTYTCDVTYRIEAENGKTKDYVITLTINTTSECNTIVDNVAILEDENLIPGFVMTNSGPYTNYIDEDNFTDWPLITVQVAPAQVVYSISAPLFNDNKTQRTTTITVKSDENTETIFNTYAVVDTIVPCKNMYLSDIRLSGTNSNFDFVKGGSLKEQGIFTDKTDHNIVILLPENGTLPAVEQITALLECGTHYTSTVTMSAASTWYQGVYNIRVEKISDSSIGYDYTLTISLTIPDDIYALADILTDGKSIGTHEDYTLEITTLYPATKFSTTQYRYIINLPEHTQLAFPAITGVPNDEQHASAKVVNGINQDSLKIDTVYVIDKNGVKQSPDYIVEVNKLACSEDRIAGMSLMGKPVNMANGFDYDFDPNNTLSSVYSITLPEGQTFVQPDIDSLKCHAGHETVTLTVDNSPAHPVYCDYIFTTTSQRGTHRVYTIREFKVDYSDAQLIKIVIGPDIDHLSPLDSLNATFKSNYNFRPERLEYSVRVASHTPYIIDILAHGYQVVDSKIDKSQQGNESVETYTYTVESKDKSQTLTYTVKVYVTCRIYLLQDVFVSGVSVIDGFYEADENNFVCNRLYNNGQVLPELSDIQAVGQCALGHQTIDIKQVVADTYSHVFVISSQAASGQSATYTIYCTLNKSDNANLDMISVSGRELTCNDASCTVQTSTTFNYNVQFYTVTLDYGVTVAKDNISAVTQDPNATYVVVGAGKSYQILVTAPDGVTTKTYSVNIENRQSNEASVVDIIVNYQSLAGQGFNPQTDDKWTTYVENRSQIWMMHPDSLTISWLLSNPLMTGEEIFPRQQINDSTYQAVVCITAPDNVTKKYYTITIINRNTIVLSNNALLVDLKANGVTVAGFASDKFHYEVEVGCDIQVPIIGYQGAEPGLQTIVKTDATGIPGRTVVSVTAQDGLTQNFYIIDFKDACSKEPSHNALLDNITLTDASVLTPVFNPEQFIYTAVYPANTSLATVPSHLAFTPQDTKAAASASRWANSVGDTTIIHVVAEDGYTNNDYYVIYIVDGMAQPYLKDLGFQGDGSVANFDNGTISGFEPQIFNYNITLSNASIDYLMDESKVSIIAVPLASTGVVEKVTRTAIGTSSMVVTVKVSDFGESNTYTVNVTIAPSSDAHLDDIIVNGYNLVGTDCDDMFRVDKPFSPDVTQYNIAVSPAYDIEKIDIWSFEYIFGNAQQEITSEINVPYLNAAQQVVAIEHIITVRAGDNTTLVYRLMFVQKNGSALLSELRYDGVLVEGWNPEENEFVTFFKADDKGSIDASKVSYVTENVFQNVDVVQLNDSVVMVTVTADDCSQNTYLLKTVGLTEWNHLLADLTVNDRTIVDFKPQAFYYDFFVYSEDKEMLLANADNTIGIPFDSTAIVTYETVQGNDGVYLYITVTDRAGGQSEYTVFYQLVPYNINSRAETWDVGVVHVEGDVYKIASHKNNVSFVLYDQEGKLINQWAVPLIDPNQSVDDRNNEGREIEIPADRVWIYTFYWNNQERVERGKLMHISK